jgi:uncharacterized membrane protein YesL
LKQITAAVEVLKQSIIDWWYAWVNLAVVNLAWLFCVVTVLLAFPATFGLFYASREAAYRRSAGFNDFVQGLRRYFWRGWQWGLLNALAVALVYANILFYGQVDEAWAAPLLALTLYLALMWVIIQLYAIPYLMEQEAPHMRVAYKNAAFTALASPLYTLVLLAFIALLVGLMVWQFPLVVAGFVPLIAVIANHAVLERLKTFGIKETLPDTGEIDTI